MPALDQETFNVWREGDDRFKQAIQAHVESQTTLNLALTERLTRVEEQQKSADKRAATWSSVISSIAGAIMGGLTGSLR
jgi:hypothetical protein